MASSLLRRFPIGLMVAALLQTGCGPTSPTKESVANAPAALAPASAPTPPSADQIRVQLAAAANDSPADPQPHLELALFDARTGRMPDALAALRETASRYPAAARVQSQLGTLLLQSGDYTAAYATLKRAATLDTNDSETLFFAALASYRSGHAADVKRYAAASMRIDPDSPHPYLLLSYLNDRHGTATQALANLRDYIARSPQPAPGYFLMGRIYAKLNDRVNAEAWLKRALDSEQQNPSFWVALGRLYAEQFGMERMADGIRCYEQALAVAPTSPEAHRYLGHALLQQQRYAAAELHLRAAAGGSAPHGAVAYDLGQALIKLGRADEGRRYLAIFQRETGFSREYTRLAAAVDAKPSDAARQMALTRYCLDNGQYAMAEQAAMRGINAAGPNAELQRALTEARAHNASKATPSPTGSQDVFTLMEGGSGGD